MLLRRLTAEFLGTAGLLCTVVGSGALMHKLDAGNVAVTVFGVAAATGLVLYALIEMLGTLSAHFNPVVTLVNALQRNIKWSAVIPYFTAQIFGAITGVVLANLMFEQAPISISETARTGTGQWLGEIIATFGLIGVITGCSRFKPAVVPQAVSAYVAGAIMFTSSTCFANPAVTISRVFTTTITGIRPADVPVFIVCEVVTGILAMFVFGWLCREETSKTNAPDIDIPVRPAVSTPEKELVATR
jgi:glycerol uptake facilitator-like aquaporin